MTPKGPLLLDGNSLTIKDVIAVARQGRPAQLAPMARERMAASRAYVESLLVPGAPPVYGINTGFGIFANRSVPPEQSAMLSRNLILSHAIGAGEPLAEEIVRAAMLIRANTLALGYSGARVEIVETLLAMLNAGVHPVIPEQGSLGSSGDLAPLSHLALVLSCDGADIENESGEAFYGGKRMSGKAAMQAAGIPRIVLGAKEGLALNNGATFSAAVAALAIADSESLARQAQIATAMALEALLGASCAFDERLHAARKQKGQASAAANIRALIAGSSLVDSDGRVQDAYCLRCAPQIIGPVLDTLAFVRGLIENEINAATDNPLIFEANPKSQNPNPKIQIPNPKAQNPKSRSPNLDSQFAARSGGNFHGEVVGLAMDYLGIAMAEVGALAERQIDRMVNDKYSYGLPPMLVRDAEAAGLNSGLMMPHYTAVALVLENQTLAHPDSAHSLPTSAGQEDHNANAFTAARHARQIVRNVAHVLAIEFFAAAQALDLRVALKPGLTLSPSSAAALARIRREIAFVSRDRLYQPDVERAHELVASGELVRAVEAGAGIQLL